MLTDNTSAAPAASSQPGPEPSSPEPAPKPPPDRLTALRTKPVNITKLWPTRDLFLALGGCQNLLGVIAMMRMLEDCPQREELRGHIRALGIDPDQKFSWKDLKEVLSAPNYP